jgi:hypothetical protein
MFRFRKRSGPQAAALDDRLRERACPHRGEKHDAQKIRQRDRQECRTCFAPRESREVSLWQSRQGRQRHQPKAGPSPSDFQRRASEARRLQRDPSAAGCSGPDRTQPAGPSHGVSNRQWCRLERTVRHFESATCIFLIDKTPSPWPSQVFRSPAPRCPFFSFPISIFQFSTGESPTPLAASHDVTGGRT